MRRHRLVQRRKAVGLSQERLAEMLAVDRSTVVRWEVGTSEPQPWHRPRLAEALKVSTEELAALLLVRRSDAGWTGNGDDLVLDRPDLHYEDVDRRSFLPIVALPMTDGLSAIAELLTPLNLLSRPESADHEFSLVRAEHLIFRAKSLYQACRYQETLTLMPALLNGLGQIATTVKGDQQRRVATGSVDAYHVLASIMLKLDDKVLASLAAQRAMAAANQSGDPVAIACGTRIMVHTLMSAGHGQRAVNLADAAATSLRGSPEAWCTSDGKAAYGALLLRAAVAAALSDNRDAAESLVSNAAIAAHQLGHDANDRWTGFGPTNVEQHRVHIALTLGDAGNAIDRARRINFTDIKLAERKASLYTDMARAYLQRNNTAASLNALEAAFVVAPEEIRNRSYGRRLCNDLLTASRGPLRDRAINFAMRAGLHHDR